MNDKPEVQKLPMYYQQIYDLMQHLNEAYSKRLGQIYFRAFKQFYSRVRFELKKERRQYYDDKIRELEDKYEDIETTEFRGYTVNFPPYAEKSKALLRPVYDMQIELYEDLEDSKIFNYLKQNMNDMELI